MTLKPAVVDLSHWNEVTDFAALKASGIVGVILKASQGTSYDDPTYVERRSNAHAAGLLVGAYHFLDGSDPGTQAEWFLHCAAPLEELLLAADFEDNPSGSTASLDHLRAFLATVYDETGQRAAIYSGNLIKECLGGNADAELGLHRLWLAHYSSTPTWPTAVWPKWWLHQYTDKGEVPGVTPPTDLNGYYGTAEQLAAEWTGMQDVEPEPQPEAQITVSIRITVPPGASVTIGTE